MMLLLINIILLMSRSSHQLQLPWVLNDQKVFIDEVRQCASQGTRDIVWDLKLRRLSRQQVVLQGNITMTVPLDNKVAAVIAVAEKGNGGWVERGFVFILPHFCQDLMLAMNKFWISFWVKAGISPPITCPIPKGKYLLKDFSTSEVINHVPGLKQGSFKANVEFLNNNNSRLGCIAFIYHS